MNGRKFSSLLPCRQKGPLRSFRHEPPVHYVLKVHSFSMIFCHSPSMLEQFGVFEAGGYKWRLVLYPSGNSEENSVGYLSLYLTVVDTCSMISGWELDVIFRLFLYNHLRDQYLTLEEPSSACFNETTKRRGYARFIDLHTFLRASSGYLVGDRCVIGAEVFVVNEKRKCRSESLSPIRSFNHNSFTWIIRDFSKAIQSPCSSKVFKVEDFEWTITLGVSKNGTTGCNSLSLNVLFSGSKVLRSDSKVYASYTLRMVDQNHCLDFSRDGKHWFGENESFGWENFIRLSEVTDPEKGFIRHNKCCIGADISVIAVSSSSRTL